MNEAILLKGNSTLKQLELIMMQQMQHELLAFNPIKTREVFREKAFGHDFQSF